MDEVEKEWREDENYDNQAFITGAEKRKVIK